MHSRRGGPVVRQVPKQLKSRLTSDVAVRTVETVQIPAPLRWRNLFSPLSIWRLFFNLTHSTTTTVAMTVWTPHQNKKSLPHDLDAARSNYARNKMQMKMKDPMTTSNAVSTRVFSFGNDATHPMTCFPALHISRRYVFVPIAPTDSPASHWYARQLCADRTMATRTAFVVGCVASAGDRWPAAELLSLLPHDERAAAVAQLLSLLAHHQSEGQLGKELRHTKKEGVNEEGRQKEEELVQTVLCDPSATVDDAWMILHVCIQRNISPAPRWARDAAYRILTDSHRTTRSRVAAVLSLLERSPVVRRDALAEQCEVVGLTLEAAAYRSNASGPPTDSGEAIVHTAESNGNECNAPNPRDGATSLRNATGFGPDVAELLAQLTCWPRAADALAALEALRSEMSPAVAAHTMRRVALSLTRREWDQSGAKGRSDASMPMGLTSLDYISKAQGIPLPIAAFRLHFAMALGSESTCRALLSSCRGRLDRVARVMRRTRGAGAALALDALQDAMDAAPQGQYYVILRLQRSGATLLATIAHHSDTYTEVTCASALLGMAARMRQTREEDAAFDALHVATRMLRSNTHIRKDKVQTCIAALETAMGAPHAFYSLNESHTFPAPHAWNAPSVMPLKLSVLRRVLTAASAADLSPSVDVIAVSPQRRRIFCWSSSYAYSDSYSSSTSSTSSASCATSRAPRSEGHFPLATLLYRRAAIGLAHLVFHSSHVFSHTSDSHAAVRLAAFAPEIANDDFFRLTLLRAVGALTHHTQRKETRAPISHTSPVQEPKQHDSTKHISLQRRQGRRRTDSQLVATIACVAAALVARGRWADALRILPPAANELPPLLRAVRIRAMARSVEYRAHAEMLLEAEMPLHSPMLIGIRRLVVAANLQKEFDWWR